MTGGELCLACIYDRCSQEDYDERIEEQRLDEMYKGEYQEFLHDYYELLDYEDYFDYGSDGF